MNLYHFKMEKQKIPKLKWFFLLLYFPSRGNDTFFLDSTFLTSLFSAILHIF
jgi:hypothetical protein